MPDNAELRLAMVLQALGDNAEDIAHLLQYGGWLGLPNDVNSCPIALYLRTVVTDVTDAAVSSDQAKVHTVDGADITVDLTSPGRIRAGLRHRRLPRADRDQTDDNGDVIDELDL